MYRKAFYEPRDGKKAHGTKLHGPTVNSISLLYIDFRASGGKGDFARKDHKRNSIHWAERGARQQFM